MSEAPQAGSSKRGFNIFSFCGCMELPEPVRNADKNAVLKMSLVTPTRYSFDGHNIIFNASPTIPKATQLMNIMGQELLFTSLSIFWNSKCCRHNDESTRNAPIKSLRNNLVTSNSPRTCIYTPIRTTLYGFASSINIHRSFPWLGLCLALIISNLKSTCVNCLDRDEVNSNDGGDQMTSIKIINSFNRQTARDQIIDTAARTHQTAFLQIDRFGRSFQYLGHSSYHFLVS